MHKGFYWFTDAWLTDPGVQQSSWQAKGLWIDMLCRASYEWPRGVLPGDPIELAVVMGIPRGAASAWVEETRPLIEELERNGVFSRGADVHDRLPKTAIVSRRMFRESLAELARSEKAERAARIRWSGAKGMLGDARRVCSDDARSIVVSAREPNGSDAKEDASACSKLCHSYPTLPSNGCRSTVSRRVGGVGEGAGGADALADRLARIEAMTGLDPESKRAMVADVRRRYGQASPASDGTVGPSAQRLTDELHTILDSEDYEPKTPDVATAHQAPVMATATVWKPASKRQRSKLVERIVQFTGDDRSRRNWWQLVSLLSHSEEGERRLLAIVAEQEDRNQRRDRADMKPTNQAAVLNSLLRAACRELGLIAKTDEKGTNHAD